MTDPITTNEITESQVTFMEDRILPEEERLFTEVNGVAVVAETGCQTNLGKSLGRTIEFKRVRELTLATGDVIYGCTECKECFPSAGKASGHLSTVHGNRRPYGSGATAKRRDRARIEQVIGQIERMTVAELLDAAEQTEFLIIERDGLAERVRDLERELREVRAWQSGFRKLMGTVQ